MFTFFKSCCFEGVGHRKFLRTSDSYVFHKLGNRKIINYLIIIMPNRA